MANKRDPKSIFKGYLITSLIAYLIVVIIFLSSRDPSISSIFDVLRDGLFVFPVIGIIYIILVPMYVFMNYSHINKNDKEDKKSKPSIIEILLTIFSPFIWLLLFLYVQDHAQSAGLGGLIFGPILIVLLMLLAGNTVISLVRIFTLIFKKR
jgi:hypothetical protein